MHELCSGKVAFFLEKDREVVDARQGDWMIGAENLFVALERPAIERLSGVVVASRVEKNSEVVEAL